MKSEAVDTSLPPLWAPKLTLDQLTVTSSNIAWLNLDNGDVQCVLQSQEAMILALLSPNSSRIEVVKKVEMAEDDPVIAFTAALIKGRSDIQVVTAHKSTLLRLWSGPNLDAVATFKAQHLGPVIAMRISETSGWLYTASASADMSVKVWNLKHQQCMQTMRPVPSKPTSLCLFSKTTEEDTKVDEYIAIGTVEGCISVWKQGNSQATHLRKHVSPIAAIVVSDKYLIAAGRDQIVSVWNTNTWNNIKVIPLFENLNTLAVCNEATAKALKLDTDEIFIWTGGEKGQIKLWNALVGQEHHEKCFNEMSMDTIPISSIHCKDNSVCVVQEDVILRSIPSAKKKKTAKQQTCYSLNENEVTDLALIGSNNQFLVIATASNVLKCMNMETGNISVAYCPDEVTMALSGCRNGSLHFASTGREREIRLWKISDSPVHQIEPLGTLSGHSASVKCMVLLERALVSADQDGILKLWQLNEDLSSGSALITKIGHQKEVQCVELNLSKGLIVTGSLDKEIKLWRAATLDQITVLKGHRRGVVCAAFSAYDNNIVITGSSDLTCKLWHTSTFTCVHTIEGLPGIPTKLVSLERKNNLVVGTSTGHLTFHDLGERDKSPIIIEAHQEQIWALCPLGESEIITGGKDGRVVIWKDNKDEVEKEKARRRESAIKEEQALANLVVKGDLKRAVNLAIKLDKPSQTYKHLVQAQEEERLDEVLEGVSKRNLPRLVDFIRHWNSSSRQVVIAQSCQYFLLSKNLISPIRSEANLQGLLLYNQKHFGRLKALSEKVAIVDQLLLRS